MSSPKGKLNIRFELLRLFVLSLPILLIHIYIYLYYGAPCVIRWVKRGNMKKSWHMLLTKVSLVAVVVVVVLLLLGENQLQFSNNNSVTAFTLCNDALTRYQRQQSCNSNSNSNHHNKSNNLKIAARTSTTVSSMKYIRTGTPQSHQRRIISTHLFAFGRVVTTTGTITAVILPVLCARACSQHRPLVGKIKCYRCIPFMNI